MTAQIRQQQKTLVALFYDTNLYLREKWITALIKTQLRYFTSWQQGEVYLNNSFPCVKSENKEKTVWSVWKVSVCEKSKINLCFSSFYRRIKTIQTPSKYNSSTLLSFYSEIFEISKISRVQPRSQVR